MRNCAELILKPHTELRSRLARLLDPPLPLLLQPQLGILLRLLVRLDRRLDCHRDADSLDVGPVELDVVHPFDDDDIALRQREDGAASGVGLVEVVDRRLDELAPRVRVLRQPQLLRLCPGGVAWLHREVTGRLQVAAPCGSGASHESSRSRRRVWC